MEQDFCKFHKSDGIRVNVLWNVALPKQLTQRQGICKKFFGRNLPFDLFVKVLLYEILCYTAHCMYWENVLYTQTALQVQCAQWINNFIKNALVHVWKKLYLFEEKKQLPWLFHYSEHMCSHLTTHKLCYNIGQEIFNVFHVSNFVLILGTFKMANDVLIIMCKTFSCIFIFCCRIWWMMYFTGISQSTVLMWKFSISMYIITHEIFYCFYQESVCGEPE